MFSFIVPSCTRKYVEPFIRSIPVHPNTEVIVCDNGIDADVTQITAIPVKQIEVPGGDDFCFAKAINAGLLASNPDYHKIVINDDTTVEYFLPDDILHAIDIHPDLGLLSAMVKGGVGNPQQKYSPQAPSRVAWHTNNLGTCFVATVIPIKTYQTVGLLDERFVGYGEEDIDYTYRVWDAGLKTATTDRFLVVHGFPGKGSGNSFHKHPKHQDRVKLNRRLIREKWPEKYQNEG